MRLERGGGRVTSTQSGLTERGKRQIVAENSPLDGRAQKSSGGPSRTLALNLPRSLSPDSYSTTEPES